MKNKTFIKSDPIWANACVGNNGHPSYIDYAKGFSSAANLLLNEVINGEGTKHSVDDFVYPICFNMRHSIELRLKVSIDELKKLHNIKARRAIDDFENSSSHDIGNIWEFFISNAKILDKRYEQFIDKLDCYIRDIADIDATGQVFRYPDDTDRRRHLVDTGLINLFVLRSRFSELERILDELHNFNILIVHEYSLGSFTKNLSRIQLFQLTKELPPRQEWASRLDKQRIKESYGISSNELSKALKIIQANYEMGSLICATLPLKGVNFQTLCIFLDDWEKLHPINEQKSQFEAYEYTASQPHENLETYKRNETIRTHCWEKLSEHCGHDTHDSIYKSTSGLSSLYYFCETIKYSEEYIELYNSEILSINNQPEECKTLLFHLLEKTDALRRILSNIYFLGHKEIAKNIVDRYKLDQYADWLNGIQPT